MTAKVVGRLIKVVAILFTSFLAPFLVAIAVNEIKDRNLPLHSKQAKFSQDWELPHASGPSEGSVIPVRPTVHEETHVSKTHALLILLWSSPRELV